MLPSRSEPRQIDPQLIYLLKEFKLNPQMYPKERTEQLLKPYRDSGELEYLMNNKEVLEAKWKSTRGPQNPGAAVYDSRSGSEGRPPSHPRSMPYAHSFVPKADKYRTVPCKYYHRYILLIQRAGLQQNRQLYLHP